MRHRVSTGLFGAVDLRAAEDGLDVRARWDTRGGWTMWMAGAGLLVTIAGFVLVGTAPQDPRPLIQAIQITTVVGGLTLLFTGALTALAFHTRARRSASYESFHLARSDISVGRATYNWRSALLTLPPGAAVLFIAVVFVLGSGEFTDQSTPTVRTQVVVILTAAALLLVAFVLSATVRGQRAIDVRGPLGRNGRKATLHVWASSSGDAATLERVLCGVPATSPTLSAIRSGQQSGGGSAQAPASSRIGSAGSETSWWARRRKGAKVALVLAGVIVLAALAGGLTPLVLRALQPSDAELLQTLATTADAGARQKAATELAARHSIQATRELVAVAATSAPAKDGLAALRDEYIAAFYGEKQTETLVEHEDALKETVLCLAVIGGPESTDALGSLVGLKYEGAEAEVLTQASDLKCHVVQTLGRTKGTAALPYLLDALLLGASGDPTGRIRRAALAAFPPFLEQVPQLPEAVEPLVQARIRAESVTDPSVSSAIEKKLALIGDPAVPSLVDQLGRAWAQQILAEMGEPAVPAVSRHLTDDDQSKQYGALSVLLTLYERDEVVAAPHLVAPAMIPLLIKARSEAGYGDRREATIEAALVRIGEPAVEPLMAVPSRAEWAQQILADMGEPAIPAVIKHLTDEESMQYRSLSVLLLLYQRDEAVAAPHLVAPALIPLLIEARAGTWYDDQRDATIEVVLARIGKPVVKELMAFGSETPWGLDVLVAIGEPAVSALTDSLKSSDRETRELAAEILVKMQGAKPELVSGLLAAIEEDNLKFVAQNYAFYIKLGQAGTEDILTRALNKYARKNAAGETMALDYLNCGNEKLDAAARQWCAKHGYTVYTQPGAKTGPQWGEG
jgi:hypothetical protein